MLFNVFGKLTAKMSELLLNALSAMEVTVIPFITEGIFTIV